MTDDLLSSVGDGIERSITNQTENMAQTLGRWCSTFLSNTPYVMEWRFNNLVNISNKFDHLCNAQGIPKDRRNEVSKKFGVLWLDGASLEEDDLIQELWAKILAEEAKIPESQSINMINILKNMRKNDAEAFQLTCSLTFYYRDECFIPMFEEEKQSVFGDSPDRSLLFGERPDLMMINIENFAKRSTSSIFLKKIENFISKKKLLKLESLGLISLSTNFNTEISNSDKLTFNGDELILKKINTVSSIGIRESISLATLHLTQDGINLSKMINTNSSNEPNNKDKSKNNYFEEYIQKNLIRYDFKFEIFEQ